MVKIEYSKDLEKAKIANVSIGIDGKKIVRLYEHNMNDNYRVNDTTEDEETLKIIQQDKCLVELIFFHNESIESLIRVLESLKDKDFIEEQDNPEMYKKINNALSEEKNNLVLHAENELDILLNKCKDEEGKEIQKVMNNDILEIVEAFSNQGHSGFSASYAIGLIKK